jgi:hypothetical protein
MERRGRGLISGTSPIFARMIRENHKNPHSGYLVTGRDLNPEPPKWEGGVATLSITTIRKFLSSIKF